jgi:nucleotide-binding universal stress UspA family protein
MEQHMQAIFGETMGVQRILIPVGEQKATARALEVGIAMAQDLGAAVRLVHVIDPCHASPPEGGVSPDLLLADLRRAGQHILDSACACLPGHLQVDTALVEGKPAKAISGAAQQWQADMIVMGTHARKGLWRILFGSVSEAVMRQAPCPVVTVRPDERVSPVALSTESTGRAADASFAG